LAGYIPRWYTRPKTVTRPSRNRARRALTSFVRRTPLTARPRQVEINAEIFSDSRRCFSLNRPVRCTLDWSYGRAGTLRPHTTDCRVARKSARSLARERAAAPSVITPRQKDGRRDRARRTAAPGHRAPAAAAAAAGAGHYAVRQRRENGALITAIMRARKRELRRRPASPDISPHRTPTPPSENHHRGPFFRCLELGFRVIQGQLFVVQSINQSISQSISVFLKWPKWCNHCKDY